MGLRGVVAEDLNGANAIGCEGVVNVVGEVLTDRPGREGKAGSPFADQVFDVGDAIVAGTREVFDELL